MKRVGKNTSRKKNTRKTAKWKIAALISCYALLLAAIGFLLIVKINASAAERIAETSSESARSVFEVQEAAVIAEVDPAIIAVSPGAQESSESEASQYGADVTAPVIEGVKDLTVHMGDTISYKSGITVKDNMDPDPILEVDTSGVDLSTLGEYFVFYVAQDASGNRSYEAARVNVVPQKAITSEEANALADEILAAIITDGMTDGEKLTAVYRYLHSLGYVDVDYGEGVDYLENAYYFLTTHRGNCRCYYGASRLLLERLGYQTIMIHSFYGAPMTHFWNLVSVDGGKTYYHYDPTCWNWGEDGNINMVTDQWLIDYADEHDYSPLLWEVDDYPATPTEPFRG